MEQGESSGSASKYHSDDQTRGEAARGAIHGKSEREVDRRILQTKPEHITGKQGTSGRVMRIKANYFPMLTQIKWEIHHYHVEFSPQIESAAFRNALLVQQRPTIGSFLYDRGASIYTIRSPSKPHEITEIVTRDREQREILIKIKHVGQISPLESRTVQVQNIIMKKALRALNLILVGRDYFDAAASVR